MKSRMREYQMISITKVHIRANIKNKKNVRSNDHNLETSQSKMTKISKKIEKI